MLKWFRCHTLNIPNMSCALLMMPAQHIKRRQFNMNSQILPWSDVQNAVESDKMWFGIQNRSGLQIYLRISIFGKLLASNAVHSNACENIMYSQFHIFAAPVFCWYLGEFCVDRLHSTTDPIKMAYPFKLWGEILQLLIHKSVESLWHLPLGVFIQATATDRTHFIIHFVMYTLYVHELDCGTIFIRSHVHARTHAHPFLSTEWMYSGLRVFHVILAFCGTLVVQIVE